MIRTLITILLLGALLIAGCAQPGPAQPAAAGLSTGTLEVRVTDAPASDDITEIWITVSGVSAHRAVAEQEQTQQQTQQQTEQQEAEGEWISLPITGTNPFELLKIRGLEEILATTSLTEGKYTQIRMDVSKVEVKMGGSTKIATLPSGELKFIHPFDVVAGQTTILLLDFDAEKSVNVTGGDKVMFKPVIRLQVSKTQGNLKITTKRLLDGEKNKAYSATLAASGGTQPYTWSVSAGSLPAGLTLNSSTGVISGTPTTVGDYSFTIQVSDSSNPQKNATQELSISIKD